MNKEIKLRKRRFWAICFVLVFAIIQTIPSSVFAETYSSNGENLTPGTTVLHPGDVINYRFDPYNVISSAIYYYEDDEAMSLIDSESYSNSDASDESFTVKDYMGTKFSAEEFKEWKLVNIYGSGGATSSIKLVAVGYTKSTINYVLDGGTNAETNSDNYYEGKPDVFLADAEKEGYTFEGWYSDADFTTRVTSIPTTHTGTLTLYAKFALGNYNINYNLDGGENAESNPTSYTYTTGVASFADAEKEGYTFEGWYDDAEFTTQITSISDTQVGPVDLYAKFTAKNYNIFYELDGGSNGDGNPESYTYGVGVTSLADAVKDGYIFEGWFTDAEFTTQITSIDATQTGDVTLYAKFVEDEEETTTEEESTTEEETTTEEESTDEETTEEESTDEETTEEESTDEETTVEESTDEETTAEEVSSGEETTEEETTTEKVSTEEETTSEENTTNNSGIAPNDITSDDAASGDTTSNSEQPKTGDSSKWFLWAVLLMVSSCGMIGTAVYGKKKKMN